MPTSSTVWWRSTSRSPLATMLQVEPAVLPELLEHVVEEGMPVDADARPLPSTSSVELDGGLLGGALLLRRLRDIRLRPPGATSRSAARNASFSSGVPMVTRRQPVEPGPAGEVTHENAAIHQALPQRVAVAVGTQQQEVGARREHRDAVDGGELRGDALALGDEREHAVVHLGAEVEREPSGDLGGRREVVRQHDLVELLDDPRRRDREAEPQRGHRPHLRVRAHDDERAVVAHELERAPGRELAVGLVDDDEPVEAVEREQRLDGRRRLDGAGRVVGAADEHDRWASAPRSARAPRPGRWRSRRAAPPPPPRCR